VHGHDGIDRIGEGTHRRAIVTWQRFESRLAEKASRRLGPRVAC
jgi:fluoroacetyl-CoA thioesterase